MFLTLLLSLVLMVPSVHAPRSALRIYPKSYRQYQGRDSRGSPGPQICHHQT